MTQPPRANLFQASITYGDQHFQDLFTLLCCKAQIPGTEHHVTIEVLVDENYKVHDGLLEWHRDQDYRTLTVTQYRKDGSVLRAWKMSNVTPTKIGPINLAWSDERAVEVFEVVFTFTDAD